MIDIGMQIADEYYSTNELSKERLARLINASHEAARAGDRVSVQEGDILPGTADFPEGLVAVPIKQLEDIYSRFRRLAKMGQATMAEWSTMSPEMVELRRAIFSESDFGALYAGNWLRWKPTNQTDDKQDQ